MPFPSLESESDVQYLASGCGKKLRYLDSCSTLPAGRPVDFPHLIDTQPVFNELTNPTNLRLCDGVATTLFKYDPDLLSRFLDLSISEVFFLREEHKTSLGDLVIWRKDRTVIVSWPGFIPGSSCHFHRRMLMYQQCAFYNRVNNVLDYESRVTSRIHDDGRWEATSADGATMQFMPKPISPVEVTKNGMRLGQAMLVHEKWSNDGPAEIHTSKPDW